MRPRPTPEPAAAGARGGGTAPGVSWLLLFVVCAWLVACLDAAHQKKTLATGSENESYAVSKERRPAPSKKLMASLHHDLKDLRRLLLNHHIKKSKSDTLLAYLIDANGYKDSSRFA